MRLIFILALALFSTSFAAQAEDLQNCDGEAFRQAIGADKGFKCAEISRQAYTANGQSFTIRALRDASTNPQFVDQHAAETVDAMLNAVSVFDDLAPQFGFEFGHVSILIIDPNRTIGDMKGEKISGVFAEANFGAFPRECIIRINVPVNDKWGMDAMRNTAAHEFFHCVQGWSYSKSAIETAQWWMEGSAEFFASQVQIDTERLDSLGTQFVGTIETVPLTQQPYNSVVFFAWLWSQGPDKVAAFFKGASTISSQSAQMDATLESVGEAPLQEFAQALTDGKIAMPNGYTFPAPPEQVETTTIDDDQKTIELEVKRFTLVRHALHFVNGTYNAWAGGSSFYKRDQMGGEWSELDPSEQIEPDNCKDIKMVLTARFITEGFASKTALSASRLKKCLECTKMPKVDQCVVGKWQMSNEALLTYLQATNGQQKATNFSGVGGSAFLVFNKDGTAQFVAEGLKIGAEVKIAEDNEDMILVNVEANGIDSGEWGTGEGGAMNYCAKETSLAFNIRVELPTGLVNESEEQGLLSDSIWSYSCAGNDLALRYVGPNTLPDGIEPRWQLTRAP